MILINNTSINFILSCFFVLLSISSCNNLESKVYSQASSKAQYKIISFSNNSNDIEDGDLVEFKALYITNKKDTLISDSTKLNELFNDTITFATSKKSDLVKVISKLQEGDSCLALFYSGADLSGRLHPKENTISKNDTIYTFIKVKHIYKGNERQKYLLEETSIARYITFSKQVWQASENGIFYRIVKQSANEKLKYNDPVKLVYKGYFLNKQVFDNYAEINPYFEYSVGTQNQLISGMEMAIKYMSYGSEAEFIFPSSLAFGKHGSSTGIVPAYKPVLYKVKILDKEAL
jgi:FKBP-type peptidyl-prolyl cis-trans isomerase